VKDIHDDSITSVTSCTDGLYLLTNSRDNKLKLIDTRMFKVVSTFEDENYHNGYSTNRAAISSNGRYAVVGSTNGYVLAFDLIND
jgi:WD40 repeat protein